MREDITDKKNPLEKSTLNISFRGMLTILALFVVVTILMFVISAYIYGSFYALGIKISNLTNDIPHSKFFYGFTRYRLLSLLTALFFSIVTVVVVIRKRGWNEVAYTDKGRGLDIMQGGTYGTAHDATNDEINQYFNIDSIENSDGIIYGQLKGSSEGEKVVTFKKMEGGATLTMNTLVIASSGAGKSTNLVIPNLINCVNRGHSLIVVDNKGELYRKTAEYTKSKDYNTNLLNLKNLDYSDSWNCLYECISDETKRIDIDKTKMFVDVIMKNARIDADDDPFWQGCASNMIQAIISYLAYNREEKILSNFKSLYIKMTGVKDQENDEFIYQMEKTFISLVECENRLIEIARENNISTSEIRILIKEIYDKAPPFNIDEVYSFVEDFVAVPSKNIEGKEKYLDRLQEHKYHPGYNPYREYLLISADPKVKSSAILGTQQKFHIFTNPKIRAILSRDGISFKSINKRKSIYYIATPDGDVNTMPIASLFFSFFISNAMDNYDKEEEEITRLKEVEGIDKENGCIPTMLLADEFTSLGVVTGNEERFERFMSTARSRNIYSMLIIQYYRSLENTYQKYADGIESACTTKVFMGASDQYTLEKVSDWCGVTTVRSDSHKENNTLIGVQPQNDNINFSTAERKLYTPDELSKIINQILLIRQPTSPLLINMFPYFEHPAYKNGEMKETSYYKLKSLKEKIKEEMENDISDKDTHINDLIQKVSEINNDIVNEFNQKEKEKLDKETAMIQKKFSKENNEPPKYTTPYNERTCPECGKKLTIRKARNPKDDQMPYFIGCCGYPECEYKEPANPLDLQVAGIDLQQENNLIEKSNEIKQEDSKKDAPEIKQESGSKFKM